MKFNNLQESEVYLLSKTELGRNLLGEVQAKDAQIEQLQKEKEQQWDTLTYMMKGAGIIPNDTMQEV